MPSVAPSACDSLASVVGRSSLGQSARAILSAWLSAWLPGWLSGHPGRPRVVLGCSGGPDSTALLLALWALRDELAIEVHVVCVDHQLRPEARAEAAVVVEVASRLGLGAEHVAVRCASGASRMAAARRARYDALALAARRLGAEAVLVAHTREDQTETMLMRWLAGSGLLGLGGMEAERELPVPGQPARPVTLLRPLLTTSRAEVDALLAQAAALVAPLPLHDPSNVDRHYQRSRLRHDLLPALRREQPQLDGRLAQLSAQLRDDSDYLEQQAEVTYQALSRQASTDGKTTIALPLAALAALPPALFARVVMRASGGGLGQAHIAALRGLCAHGNGTHCLDLPGGRWVERRYAQLRFFAPGARPPAIAQRPPEQLLAGCGDYALGDGTLSLHWESSAAGTTGLADAIRPSALRLRGACREARLLLPLTAFPLTLRPPRPGDRIRLSTTGGQRKVSDLLIDLKVPRFERATIALLCWGDQILWVVGHRVAAPPLLPPQEPSAERPPPSVLVGRFQPASHGP